MALDALYVAIKRKRVNWILDLDLKSFVDNISHEKVERRIADPRVLRLIQKWLKAGVMEDGVWSGGDVLPGPEPDGGIGSE